MQPALLPGPCFYDCNSDGRVKINEVQLMANIFLGFAVVSRCPPLEGWERVNIADVQAAANEFLNGCLGLSGPTMPGQ